MDALNERSCFEAVRRRDKRFDGRFYTGVRTTGIFCRPSCPSRTPKPSNVVFFVHTASAVQQGFRPCRRCRPELAPGSSDWDRRGDLVSKAVSYVHTGRIRTVSELASYLGVSQRHLRRELHAELGTTPQALLMAHRVALARLLLDQTSLPITDIAFASGFGSVRRFNEVVQETFHTTPTNLRSDGNTPIQTAGAITLSLASQGAVNWPFLLEFFRRRAVQGLEEVVGTRYRLSVPAGSIELSGSSDDTSLQIVCELENLEVLRFLLPRLRRMVDLETDTSEIAETFRKDVLLGPKIETNVPPLPTTFALFEACIRAIIGQQISVAGARTLLGKFLQACQPPEGEKKPVFGTFVRFPTPTEILAADLTSVGLVKSRQETIANLAGRLASGSIELTENMPAAELRSALIEIPGIGPWTAGYIGMRGLGDPDGWPTNDLILRKSAALGSRSLEKASDSWRPWRAYAAMLLWSTYTESS